MTRSPIQTIIFDFGNVIGFFDFQITLGQILPHTDLTGDEIRAAIAGSDLEDAYETGRITSAEFVERLRDLCQLRCEPALVQSAWTDIFQPNDDVCRFLLQLSERYRLLLGSNTNELHANHFRRQFAEHFEHFDHLVLSHEVGARKPHRAFFNHCVEAATCKPAQCVFIDDLEANIAGAVDAGLHGIVYRDINDLQSRLSALGVEWK